MGGRGGQGPGQGRGAEGATEGQLYLPQVCGLLEPLLQCSSPGLSGTEATYYQLYLVSA